MDKKKIIYKIIEIICTAIISIAAVLTAQSCTMSLSVSKNNSNSTQKTNKQQLAQLTVHKSILTQKSKNYELKRSLQNQEKRCRNR